MNGAKFNGFTVEEKERITEGIRQKYAKVAASPEGNFRYPVGRAGLEGQRYDPEIIKSLPDDVADSFCGVGNPFLLGEIHEGDHVLDIGCGAGVDTLIAAMMTGSAGKAVGIDLVRKVALSARTPFHNSCSERIYYEEESCLCLSDRRCGIQDTQVSHVHLMVQLTESHFLAHPERFLISLSQSPYFHPDLSNVLS